MWDTSIRIIRGEPWQRRDRSSYEWPRENAIRTRSFASFRAVGPIETNFPDRSSGLARISTARGTRRNRAPWRNPWRLRNNRKIDAERDSNTLTTRRASRWERAYLLICWGIPVHLGEKSARGFSDRNVTLNISRRIYMWGIRWKFYKANHASATRSRKITSFAVFLFYFRNFKRKYSMLGDALGTRIINWKKKENHKAISVAYAYAGAVRKIDKASRHVARQKKKRKLNGKRKRKKTTRPRRKRSVRSNSICQS